MGGVDKTNKSVDGLEVFDSNTKIIRKVMDDQNNWVQTSVPGMAGDGFQTCAVPLIDKNAFVLLGGKWYFLEALIFFQKKSLVFKSNFSNQFLAKRIENKLKIFGMNKNNIISFFCLFSFRAYADLFISTSYLDSMIMFHTDTK